MPFDFYPTTFLQELIALDGLKPFDFPVEKIEKGVLVFF